MDSLSGLPVASWSSCQNLTSSSGACSKGAGAATFSDGVGRGEVRMHVDQGKHKRELGLYWQVSKQAGRAGRR